ncbi:MAG: flagellar filament capping protein FliD [Candidatus Lernaella stagnicola]|nr:flagellar filament capping protein FliD [Candidatus Lernaella stagnicola]
MSSSGVGFSGISGIDTKGIVAQLMIIERRPLDRLEGKKEAQQDRLSVLSELRTKLSSFRSVISSMNTQREFQKVSISTNDEDDEHFQVAADSTAQATNHTLKVLSLATYEKEVSQGFSSVNDNIGTGTVRVTLGSGEFRDVTIDSSNNTVAGLRDAINSLDWGLDEDDDPKPGISASILDDGDASTPYRLIISSDETGEDNTITIDTSSMSGPDTIPAFTETATAANAHALFDGVDVYSSSNKVTDIVTGLDVTLKKIDADNEYMIGVSSNAEAIKENISTFVEEYNGLMDYLDEKTGTGATDRDPMLRSLIRGLRQITYTTISNGGDYTLMSQIGISNNREGRLEIDDGDLTDALEDDFDDVVQLLTAAGTTENSAVSFLRSGENTEAGTYAVDITGVGENLAGTIGGYATYSYGENTLMGANDTPVEGLAIYFTGQSIGSYGDVTFTAGVFEEFDRMIDRYMDSTNGILKIKEESINSQIRYTDQRINRVELNLERIRERLTGKFTQMELALAQLQNMSGAITGLSALL